jgi:Cytochrome c7 and related cytochrome c
MIYCLKFLNTKGDVQMKKTVIAMIAMIAFAGSAFAAEYKGGAMGKVTFNHDKHKPLGCAKCHEGAPKKIEINKGVAHDKLCIKCHKDMKKGPVGCKDCHKK